MRYRFKTSAAKRQNKKLKKTRKVGCEVIDNAWNKNRTTRQNLASMGLAYDPNEAIGMYPEESMEVDGMNLGKAKISGSVNRQQREAGKKKGQKKGQNKGKREAAANQVLKNLEQIAIVETNEVAEQKKRKREKAKLHDNDVDFCEKMISKHGEDYDAMARDPSNIWQDTSRQIERKLAIYKRSK